MSAAPGAGESAPAPAGPHPPEGAPWRVGPHPRESAPLRVGLNLLFMGERAGGAGRYAAELPGALLAAEPATEVHVFVTREAPAELRRAPWAGSVRWTTLPIGLGGSPVELLAQFAGLPLLALARRLDVLHSPANTGPVLTPGLASVVSLLDLIWLHRGPEWEPDARARERMLTLVAHGVRHADRVFAISAAAAEDFVRTLGVPRERIEVTPLGIDPTPLGIDPTPLGIDPTPLGIDPTPLGIDPTPRGDGGRASGAPTVGDGYGIPGNRAAYAREPAAADARLRARLELEGKRVVLCVAQKRPYKNLHRLVRALTELDADVVLVLPGAPTAHEAELRALADELAVAERVRFPDWLSDAELDGLYRIGDVFVLPSLIEGFGLPVLEAMARGVPVACSNVSALPEVAGDAALLFDPERQDEVTGAIRRLLDDRALAERLIARGRERVAHFTWRRTGAASLAGYRRAIAAHGARGRRGSRAAAR